MTEIQKTRDMIEDGTNHIQVSAGRAKELAASILGLKGSLYTGAEAVAEAIRLVGIAKTNFDEVSEQSAELVREMRVGRDIFKEVGPNDSPPDEVQLMMEGLNNSVNNLADMPDMFTSAGVGEIIETLTRCYTGLNSEQAEGALEAHAANIRDYSTRVAPHYISVADEWRDSI